jgi:predicted transcriptional regulator
MDKKIIALLTILFAAGLLYAQTISIGKVVTTVKIQNPENVPTTIPGIGQKMVVIFYTDPDNKDVNEPLTEAIKAKKYPINKYVGVGIANCADSWMPNSMIRYVGRQKQAKYPNSVIMIDNDHILAKAWGLGDCNDIGYVILIGKDSKIKFAKAIKTLEESKATIGAIIKVIENEIK